MVPETPKITEVLPLLYLHGLSSGCVRRVLTVTGLDARLLMAAPVEDAVDAVAAEVAGAAERPESVRAVRSLGACRAAARRYPSLRESGAGLPGSLRG